MRWSWALALAVVGALTAQSPAWAADANQIRQEIIDLLTPEAGQDPALTYGSVDVTQEGAVYKVSVTDLRTPGAEYFEIGTVTLEIEPKEGDLYAISNVQLPANMLHKRPDGTSDGGIQIGSQRLNATWSSPLEALLAIDADYRDVKVTDETGKVALTAAALTVKSDSDESSTGKWDQQGVARVEGLSIDAGPEGKLVIGGVELATDARAVDLAAWRGLMNRVETMSAPPAGGETGTGSGGFSGGSAEPSAAQMQDALTALREAGSLIGSYSTRIELTGVNFNDPSGGDVFALGSAGLSFALEGFDQEKSAISLGYHHAGLAVAHPEMTGADPELVNQLMPQELSINIAAESLPTRAVWTSFLETALSAETPQDMNMGMAMFMTSAQQTMLESGAKLRVSDTRVVMPAAKAALEGELQADVGAPFGAIGTLNLEITGLDKLISMATATQTDPEQAQGMQAFFDLLRGFSNRETAADGAVVDRYALQLTKEGNLLLNGKDFSAFLGAMQGQP